MQVVALCGNSLVVSTIGASLQDCAELQLVHVDPAAGGAADRLRALQPGVIVFDLAAGQPDFALTLLRERPGLLLIGADPASNDLLVLSGYAAPALSVADLVNVIRQQEARAE